MRIRAVIVPAACVAIFVGALASPTLAQQDDEPRERGESLRGTLDYEVTEDGETTDVPAPGIELIVESQDGGFSEDVVTDDAGEILVELPGPGTYIVTIDPDTLPDGVELKDPEGLTREISIAPGDSRPVLYPLQEEGAESTRSESSRFEQFLQLSVEGILFGLVLAMMSVGLSLIFGTTGLVNFAHGDLVAFGALATWYLNDAGLFLPLAIVAAVVLAFFLGVGLERGLWGPLRARGTSLIAMLVISIGLGIFLRYLYLYVYGGRPRAYRDFAAQAPWDVGPVTIVPRDLWIIVLSVVILVGVGLVLSRTRQGKAVRAVADNRDLAGSSGIDVGRIIRLVWGAGTALAAVGGAFYAMSDFADWQAGSRLLLLLFAGVTLGGLGTAYGALVGSLLVGWFIQVSTMVLPTELKNVGALGLLILILVFRPQGIFGQRERIG